MSIDSIGSRLKSLQDFQQIPNIVENKGAQKAGNKSTFNDTLADAIKQVDSLQTQANQHIEGLTMQKDGYTTHGAMLALEKADVAFQLMNNIRSKIVRAYEDIIRTQV